MLFKYKGLSISKKLTLIYSSVLLGILLIFTALTFFLIRNYMIKDSEAILSSNADIVSNYISSIQNISKESFNNLSLSQGIYYTVSDSKNNVIYSNTDTSMPAKKHIEGRKRNRRPDDFEKGNDNISTSRIVSVGGQNYNIQVTKAFEDIGTKTEAIFEVLVIISILGTIVGVFSGSFLSKRLLRPIKEITKTAKEITSVSLNKRIATNDTEDELKELADTFNQMISRLETDFENQRRFVSDASHELRTPLAVIHGHVNMLNRWGKDNPEQLNKSLKTLKAESENMSKLVEGLLSLAKGDNNVLSINKQQFPVHALLKEVVDETFISHSGIEISTICDEKLNVNADYNALKQVLRILIDNSIKFSQGTPSVVIAARLAQKGICLTVKDKGIGIPKENLAKIFDRFYRVDESRTKATGGSGLGLSIAKQIVELHGGKISAASEIGIGTEITIEFKR
ncbi:MAG: HAMP domain-containing sensor histidine kinase [Bacillota bacterium]|nr:HAMP domain-containing sensor histidine kinase [Bacillota bacterium]